MYLGGNNSPKVIMGDIKEMQEKQRMGKKEKMLDASLKNQERLMYVEQNAREREDRSPRWMDPLKKIWKTGGT